MIQRIQSVYLLLAVILDAIMYVNELYKHAQIDPQTWVGIGFTAALILAGVTSLITIFLYRNRDTQIRVASTAIIFQVIALGWGIGILISLGGFGMFIWEEAMGAVFLLISLIAVVMARKKIRDDQELVQSMDRIR